MRASWVPRVGNLGGRWSWTKSVLEGRAQQTLRLHGDVVDTTLGDSMRHGAEGDVIALRQSLLGTTPEAVLQSLDSVTIGDDPHAALEAPCEGWIRMGWPLTDTFVWTVMQAAQRCKAVPRAVSALLHSHAPPLTVDGYAAMLQAAATIESLSTAVTTWEAMRANGVTPNGACYLSMLTVCHTERDGLRFQQLIYEYLDSDIVPTEDVLLICLNVSGDDVLLERVTKSAEIFQSSSGLMCAALMTHHARLGDIRGMEAIWSSLQSRPTFEIPGTAYAARIQAYARQGMWRAVQRVHAEVKKIGLTDPTATALLSAYTGAGRAVDVNAIVKEIAEAGIPYNVKRFILTVKYLATRGKVYGLSHVWMKAQDTEVPDSTSAVFHLAWGYARAGDQEQASKWWEVGLARFKASPEGAVVRPLVEAAVEGGFRTHVELLSLLQETGLDQLRSLVTLLSVCRTVEHLPVANATMELITKPVQPSLLNVLLQYFARIKAWDAIWDLAAEEGVDGHTYGILLAAFGRAGLEEDAKWVIARRSGQPLSNIFAFNLLQHYGIRQDYTGMRKVQSDMAEAGLSPCTQTARTMIRMYARAGLWEDLQRVHMESRKAGLVFDIDTYALLLGTYGKMEKTKWVEEVIVEMDAGGLVWNSDTYNAVLEQFQRSRQPEKVAELLKRMEKDGIPRTNRTYIVLFKLAGDQQDMGSLRNLWRSMTRQGLAPTVDCYNTVLDVVGRERRLEELEQWLAEMRRDEVSWDLSTYHTLFFAYGQAHHLEKVSELFVHLKQSGIRPVAATFAILVDIYGRAHRTEHVASLLRQMDLAKLERTPGTWASIIDMHRVNSDLNKMDSVCGEMMRAGHRLHERHLRSLRHFTRRFPLDNYPNLKAVMYDWA